MKNTSINLEDISSEFEGVSAKIATTLRHVDISKFHSIVQHKKPQVGDVVLAKVVSVGDDKTTLQNPDGRSVELFVGDKILVSYGHRYAVSEYEAMVPENMKECNLVSAGGVAALIKEQNSTMGEPTVIKPMGLIADKEGTIINTKNFSMGTLNIDKKTRPITLAVFGSGMDAGKTTMATGLIKGMVRAGYKVGFAKITGTGLSTDIHKPQDAGAVAVCDFVDMGYPSTYKTSTKEIIGILDGAASYLGLNQTDINIIEIADGVLQSDNQQLLDSDEFKAKIDGVFVAADSGLSAITAVKELVKHGIDVLAIGGRVMLAPLSVREFTEHISKKAKPEFGALDQDNLSKSGVAKKILQYVRDQNPGQNFKPSPETKKVSAKTDTPELKN